MDALQQNMANKGFVSRLIQPYAAPLELFFIDNGRSYSQKLSCTFEIVFAKNSDKLQYFGSGQLLVVF